MLRRVKHAAAGAVLVAIVGCGGDDSAQRPAGADADTIVGVQPRSDEQIQRESEPMTPEQAEQLGVIDTTIQVTEEP
jgi:hypothetical protein